ncbi:hypothetical protein DFQ26_001225, partial [Actinomortierella ambigua]
MKFLSNKSIVSLLVICAGIIITTSGANTVTAVVMVKDSVSDVVSGAVLIGKDTTDYEATAPDILPQRENHIIAPRLDCHGIGRH